MTLNTTLGKKSHSQSIIIFCFCTNKIQKSETYLLDFLLHVDKGELKGKGNRLGLSQKGLEAAEEGKRGTQQIFRLELDRPRVFFIWRLATTLPKLCMHNIHMHMPASFNATASFSRPKLP